MLEFIVMFRDECGDDRRAYGDFSEKVFVFPRFDENDEHMLVAFEAWQSSIIEECEREWNATHDIPMYFFMEKITRECSVLEVW